MKKKHRRKKDRQLSRWLKALDIAKIIFEYEGYHTLYLREIEIFIKESKNG